MAACYHSDTPDSTGKKLPGRQQRLNAKLSGWPRKFFGGQGAGSWPRPGLEELSRTVLAFIDRYNHTARPFNWKFTASDLTGLLRRISERKQLLQQHADLTVAA